MLFGSLKSSYTDKTAQFKAMVKMMGSKQPKKEVSSHRPYSTPIFVSISRSLAEITVELCTQTHTVLTMRGDYLSFNSPHPLMTEVQRDKFDSEREKALRQLQSLVGGERKRVKEKEMRDDEREHLMAVADGIDRRLKYIAQTIAHMRTQRLRHTARRHEVLRLSNLVEAAKKKERKEQEKNRQSGISPVTSIVSLLSLERAGLSGINSTLRNRENENEEWPGWDEVKERTKENRTVAEDARVDDEEERRERQNREALREEEEVREKTIGGGDPGATAQLMEENERMYERLAKVDREMDTVEAQVAEIQRLQETFTEKLIEQERDIDLLNVQAQETTENLREGNEWIREAITNSASRRVVILFCIVVLTFAILFVDWYNP